MVVNISPFADPIENPRFYSTDSSFSPLTASSLTTGATHIDHSGKTAIISDGGSTDCSNSAGTDGINRVEFDAPLAVIDLETTGLSPRKDRIIEIGIVFLDSHGFKEAEFSTLVNPERDLGASFIHHITAADVQDAPLFAELLPELQNQLAGRITVAHNAQFDLGFLNSEFARAGSAFRLRSARAICTLDQSRIYCAPGSHALGKLISRLGLPARPSHRALDDARATAALLQFYLAQETAGMRFTEAAYNRYGKRVTPSELIVRACAPKLW